MAYPGSREPDRQELHRPSHLDNNLSKEKKAGYPNDDLYPYAKIAGRFYHFISSPSCY